MTVKEVIEQLQKYNDDKKVYHAETIDGEPQGDTFFIVTNVFEQDDCVMIY